MATTNVKRYAEARKNAGLRKEEACVRLGISYSTLSNWEAGRTKPGANNIRDMVREYGVSADYLLGLT